jgi:diaminopimelate decarboxylase
MKKEEFYSVIPKPELQQYLRGKKLPAFFYFKKIIRQKYYDLAGCLPEGFNIHYAFKANANKDILKAINSLGMGSDVASGGELRSAVVAGFSMADIEFTGPGKTEEELSFAIDLGISCINVESISEIKKILNICLTKKKAANVGIRVNPRTRPSSSSMKMSGDTQFGIAEDEIGKALALIMSHPDLLHFTGLHMHLGSQYHDADKIISNYRFILEKSAEIARSHNVAVKRINFGGGWGIDMFGKKSPLDLSVLKKGLFALFSEPQHKILFGNSTFVVEPGRFLAAECGLYAAEVIYRKKGHQREFLILDGGMHQHYAAAGGIGQVIRRNYEVDTLSDGDASGQKTTFTVAGSLCIPDDILANDLELDSTIKEGEILVFFNSGAYGFSASPLLFLSHPLPDEVVL